MAQVIFDHATKAFGDFVAVDDFTLDVPDGDFLVLVGPSGSGKSTALRMLAGLEDISSGTIAIGDRVVNDVPPKDRDIAMVFQTYALYPHMTVADNMAFGLKLRKLSRDDIDRRVRDAAQLLDIEELLRRKPRALSGGQRQRVALGRAIVRDPAVFLLDEPLSNLDAKLRVQTRAEIRKLHERLGTSFIYVTHDQTEAMTMATRIAIMDAGVLQQVGTPQEVYDHPANVFVGGFIGSPAMNFFDAAVERGADGLQIGTGAFRFDVPPGRVEQLAAYEGRRVTIGLRPEHIHAAGYVPAGVQAAIMEAPVDLVELMGNENFLHLQSEGERFLARVDPRVRAASGERVELVFDLTYLHVFDPQTQAAVDEAAV